MLLLRRLIWPGCTRGGGAVHAPSKHHDRHRRPILIRLIIIIIIIIIMTFIIVAIIHYCYCDLIIHTHRLWQRHTRRMCARDRAGAACGRGITRTCAEPLVYVQIVVMT